MNKRAGQIISLGLLLGISAPIWIYIQYQILARVGATDIMWFLWWVNVPVSIFAHALLKIAEMDD